MTNHIVTKITSKTTGRDMDIDFVKTMMDIDNDNDLIDALKKLDTITFVAAPIVYLKKL